MNNIIHHITPKKPDTRFKLPSHIPRPSYEWTLDDYKRAQQQAKEAYQQYKANH